MSKYSNAIVFAAIQILFQSFTLYFHFTSVVTDLTVSTFCFQHSRKCVAKVHIPCTLNVNIYTFILDKRNIN